MERIWLILLLICGNFGIAAEISENSTKLQKALKIFAVAQYEYQYGAHSSPSPEAVWAYDYVHAAREKGVHAAILMLDEEAKKPIQNEELLFGLSQFLCSEAWSHFGSAASAGSSALCQSLPKEEAAFLQDGKKPTFSQEAAGWTNWWEKFKGEEYIQNYETEVSPKLEDLLEEFFFGTKTQSKTAAIKMDTLPSRERIYAEILTSSFLVDKTPKERQVGIYLKRCMELITGKHVPTPDPKISDDHKIWRKWMRSVNDTINYQAMIWPGNFWQNLDRKKLWNLR